MLHYPLCLVNQLGHFCFFLSKFTIDLEDDIDFDEPFLIDICMSMKTKITGLV